MNSAMPSGPDDNPPPEAHVRPPSAPWEELVPVEPQRGHLSFYYSDPLSKYAVRHVTRRNDNKSDPNLETMTYGLFSTCELDMRVGIVRDRAPHVFFVTNYRGERALSGYYHVRWFARGPPVLSYRRHGGTDYYLAADGTKFIHPPIPLAEVAAQTGDPWFSRQFRTYKGATSERVAQLHAILDPLEDRSELLVAEVRRLERLNMRFHGARYVNWGQVSPFDWEFAKQFLNPPKTVPLTFDRSILPKGEQLYNFWVCSQCSKEIQSVAPLKRCPACGAVGWLVPKTGGPD